MSEPFEIENMASDEEERIRLERRAARRAQMKKEKERQAKMRRMILIAIPVLLVLLIVFVAVGKIRSSKNTDKTNEDVAINTLTEEIPTVEELSQSGPDEEIAQPVATDNASNEAQTVSDENADLDSPDGADAENPSQVRPPVNTQTVAYSAKMTDQTEGINEEEVQSSYGILVDMQSGTVLAAKEAHTRINPASMTKILTVLVAADYITDLDDTFTMTIDITDYSYSHDCSSVGFAQDEVVTVRDLLYGTILPSGGDAAVGLATYVAGSQEAFVELMNEKIKELGLALSSHMTNCVGLYDENHYSTVYDMGMMLQAAVNNELCREVLKAHTYVTSSTPQHPDGITVSNWFLRRIEDKDTHGEVVCAKTGFVAQSGNCAASYATDHAGNGYICVTADAHSSWRAIYDHVALYQKYLK